MKGHIANPLVPMGGGGGIELEAGFSRLLKMTANMDVKFTVPDDVNVKSSLKNIKTRAINLEKYCFSDFRSRLVLSKSDKCSNA